MSQSDPTEHVLAAIANILEKPEHSDRQEHPNQEEASVEASTEATDFAPSEEAPVQPDIAPEPQNLAAEHEPENLPAEEAPTAVHHAEPETYSKLGPGPLTAIRFKWTARSGEHGDYFVDETIGENSRPITTGPMSKEAAIKIVDERERDARKRFDALRSEMAGGEIGRIDKLNREE
jgi:hypothetical protein